MILFKQNLFGHFLSPFSFSGCVEQYSEDNVVVILSDITPADQKTTSPLFLELLNQLILHL